MDRGLPGCELSEVCWRPASIPDLLGDEVTHATGLKLLRPKSCVWRKAIPNRRLISRRESRVYCKQSQEAHPDSLSLNCALCKRTESTCPPCDITPCPRRAQPSVTASMGSRTLKKSLYLPLNQTFDPESQKTIPGQHLLLLLPPLPAAASHQLCDPGSGL